MPVCAHCGEVYSDGRLNCPHCGADADQDWAPDPEYGDFLDANPDEDAEYRNFLVREGLAEPTKTRSGLGCGTKAAAFVLICAGLYLLI
ncbi:MAG: hypothetical protein ACYTGZ_21010 [Planctomycetota bacterium]|jgi:hypothetical protein